MFIVAQSFLFAQHSGTIFGVVTDENNEPIDGVVVAEYNSQISTVTHQDGTYSISIPISQKIRLSFHNIAFKDSIFDISLNNNETRELNVTLHRAGEQLDVVSIIARQDEGYIRIDPKLSLDMPSPTGGVEALLKSFQGVTSTNELSSQYNVRGGNYDENLIYVNDIQIYRPFLVRSGNQEGLSFVNLDLTNKVEFSAGGFSAQYGDKMSSVLDVEYKQPTKIGGSFSVGFLGATAHAEGVVKDKAQTRDVFTYLVGVRYKSNAYLLGSMETKGDYRPHFFDTQMLLNWNVSSKFEISFLGNFSINSYQYIPSNRETRVGTIQTAKKFTIYFDGQELDKYESYLGGLTFKYHIDSYNTLKLILSSYYAKESETFDIQSQYWMSDIEADLGTENEDIAQETSVRAVGTTLCHARNYLTALVSAADFRGEHKLGNNKISWGVKVQNEIINDQIKEWTRTDSTGFTLPITSTIPGEIVAFDDPSRVLSFGDNSYFAAINALNTVRFTGFVQDVWHIGGHNSQFLLNGGVRFHYWSYNREFTASPRLSLSYRPKKYQNLLFWVKTGIYYQTPFYREMRNSLGVLNDDINSQFSTQVIASCDYSFKMWKRPFKFSSEVYYKYMDNLISYNVDNLRIVYSGVNDAKGYATGIDLKLSGEFIDGMESWISLSLMKTAEDLYDDYYYDKEGSIVYPGYIPKPTDQRFAVNIFFQDHIPGFKPVRVHLNFVFASGLPYGAPNTERYQQTLRMTWYRRVDLGVSYIFLEPNRDRYIHKSKFVRAIKTAGIYLEVFNLLGISNVSSYTWVADLNNVLYAVPDYLTPRLINLKFAVEF